MKNHNSFNPHIKVFVFLYLLFIILSIPLFSALSFRKLAVRVLLATSNNFNVRFSPFVVYRGKKLVKKALYGFNGKLSVKKNILNIPKLLNVKLPVSISFKDEKFVINGVHYFGKLNIVRSDDGKTLIINVLPMEKYLCGVLPNEISPSWANEALKAQAIVSRTFVYKEMLVAKSKSRPYDLVDSIQSQVYLGIDSENERTTKAVKETTGKIITYKGKPIWGYFHSCCGGHTEDAKNVFPHSNFSYLKGVSCRYCKEAPHFHWLAILNKKKIISILNKNGIKTGKILNIKPKKVSKSNRVIELIIKTSKGRIILSGKKFRAFFGTSFIKSLRFKIYHKHEKFIFKGYGWGHGVGLCQWGAKKMAENGFRAENIIRYYYRGVRITTY